MGLSSVAWGQTDFDESGGGEASTTYFSATVRNKNTQDIIPTRVAVLDAAHGKTIANIRSNTPQDEYHSKVMADAKYTLIANSTGFAPDTFHFDPRNSSAKDWQKINDSTYHFDFKLSRPNAGSHFTYHHIYFWEHSAVMLKKPEEDFQDLLSMLKENPSIRIKIIGHVADNNLREIKLPSENEEGTYDPFLFSRNNPTKMGNGRRLSEYRAETLKTYLAQKGIDPGRIETHGRGTKDRQYPHPHTHKNNRIEIEILE